MRIGSQALSPGFRIHVPFCVLFVREKNEEKEEGQKRNKKERQLPAAVEFHSAPQLVLGVLQR